MRQSATRHVLRRRMTHRAIRALRQRSSLAPTSAKASPALKRTYEAWNHVLNHQRRWAFESVDQRTSASPPVDIAWVASFDRFHADMGERPEGTYLSRLDPSAPFSADNCRWVRRAKGSQASPNSHMHITHDGLTLSINQWAIRLGINASGIYRRYHKGLTGAAALGFPSAESLS